jgi:hypothetical protein
MGLVGVIQASTLACGAARGGSISEGWGSGRWGTRPCSNSPIANLSHRHVLAEAKLERAMTDLFLRGGRVIDPASGRDETADIGFSEGKVIVVGLDLSGRATEIVDASGLLVVPGLIDLHTHVYWGGRGAILSRMSIRGSF